MVGLEQLPTMAELSIRLGQPARALGNVVEPALLEPLRELLGRPSKGIRGRILRIAAHLAGSNSSSDPDPEKMQIAEALLEHVHSASLIIDDIQDDSPLRRGKPTIHRMYGTPLALNAGNWLYFWQLDSLSHVGLSAEAEVRLLRRAIAMYLRAHVGQALDLGAKITELQQSQVREIAIASGQLKTGALLGFAMAFGALLVEATEPQVLALEKFGGGFGQALQMFDDISMGSRGKLDEKLREDLVLLRPTWVWAVAAQELSAADYSHLLALAKDPASTPEQIFSRLQDSKIFLRASESAREFLSICFFELRSSLDQNILQSAAWIELEALTQELVGVYEKL